MPDIARLMLFLSELIGWQWLLKEPQPYAYAFAPRLRHTALITDPLK
jgi:hypothetical protein